MQAAVVATRPGTGPLPALTEGEKAAWLGVVARAGPGRGQGGSPESHGKSPVSPGFLQLSVVGAGRGRNRGSLSSVPPFFSLPDAALGDAGADAELWAAADPGRAPHPGWAALLSAVPGGRGPVCTGEPEPAHALFVPVFLPGLWALGFIGFT